MAEFDPYLSWLGIPISQRPPTAYQLLAIDPGITDPAVIKALALQRAAYVRNFQKGEHGDLCSKILEELSQAETTLADPAKRAAYDRSLKPASPPSAPKPAPMKLMPVVALPTKPKSAPVQAVLVPAEAAPKRRRTRKTRRNSELTTVLGWVVGGVALMIGVAVLVSLLRSPREQSTASNVAPSTSSDAAPEQPSTTKSNDPLASTPMSIARSSQAIAASSHSSSQTAILKISFEVPIYDVAISIDGAPKQPTKDGGAYPLSPGEHGIEILKGKTLRFATRVTLRAGETQVCRVAMSAFKAIEVEPQPAPPAKRVLNLPPHDPEEIVAARYFVEAFTIVTLLKGKAEITHSGRFYEIKAPWKEFDDGVEFHIVTHSQGRTVAVDPRIVGRDSYQSVAAQPASQELEFARKQNRPDVEIGATYLVVNKGAAVRVVKGTAKVVQGGQTFQIFATLGAFDDGIEVEFTCPGFRPLVIRIDPEQLGTRRIFVVELVSEKSAKKPSRPKKG